MELGYAPLVEYLSQELNAAGVAFAVDGTVVESARIGAAHKRELLDLAASRLGLPFVTTLGRRVADQVGHPFVRALRVATELEGALETWSRLEVLAHSENRALVEAIHATWLDLVRTRVDGAAPTMAEDALVVGLLAGLVERLGYRDVTVETTDERRGQRHWRMAWASRGDPTPAGPSSPWTHGPDYVTSCFALLLAQPSASLDDLARHMHLGARTLARGFVESGTSYRALARTARVARAGEFLCDAQHASLTEVAVACGFADGAHMSREFRALVGVPPSSLARTLSESFKRRPP